MTLQLNLGTEPYGLEVKSVPPGFGAELLGGPGIHIGDYNLTMSDFCRMVKYVITNTNLEDGTDPRLELVEWFRKLQTMGGFLNEVDPKHPDGLRRLAVSGDPRYPFIKP